MDDEYPSVALYPSVKSAIMHTLFPANDASPIWAKLRFWRFATAALGVLVVAIARLFVPERDTSQSDIYVAEIAFEGDILRILSVYDA